MAAAKRPAPRPWATLALMFVLVACQAAPTTTGANTTATQTRRLALAMRIMGAQASPVFLPADARLTVALFDNGSQPALGRWSAADQSLGPLVPQLIADAASSPLDEPAPGLSNILSALPDAPRPPADIGAAARWWIWRSFLPSVAGASEIRLDISDLRPDPAAGEGSLVLLFLVTDAAGQVLGRAHRWLSAADFPANGPLQVPVDVAVAPDTYVSHPVDLHVQPPSLELQAPTAASSLGSSSLWPSLGGETPMVPQALGEGPGGTVYLISTKLIHQIGDAGLTSMSALLGGVSLVDAELADLVGLADGTFILAIRNTLTNSGRLVHVAASGSVMGTKTQLGDGTPLPRPRSVALRNGRLLFTTDFSLFECDTGLSENPQERISDPDGLRGLAVESAGAGRVAVGRALQPGMEVVDATFASLLQTGNPGFHDGPAATARFALPEGLAYHPDGVFLLADRTNHAIRALDVDKALVATMVDGMSPYTGLGGQPLREPVDVAVDGQGRILVLEAAGSKRLLRFQ